MAVRADRPAETHFRPLGPPFSRPNFGHSFTLVANGSVDLPTLRRNQCKPLCRFTMAQHRDVTGRPN
ncbi:hypothetical protein NOVOSPHI9U_650022 [Novosphingobium sp. 9U]|nr:hypothetical protein NOVOSPHI9U_650022 [Novosphingobium sp. 9U]